MGNMIICRCNNCCFERNLNLGIGFSYPQVYNRTVERMKNGELGEEAKIFIDENPYGAVDCSLIAASCTDCGNIQSVMDLTMYIPKDLGKVKHIRRRKRGIWSIAYPGKKDDYVDVNSYENKDLYMEYRKYEHKCDLCGGRLEIIRDFELKSGELKCPQCGGILVIEAGACWD